MSIDPKKLKILLAYTLKGSGDPNGFASSIQDIVDEFGNPPSPENNYLWDDEKREFSGKFLSNNQTFDFTISEGKAGEDGQPEWSSEYTLSK